VAGLSAHQRYVEQLCAPYRAEAPRPKPLMQA
ncbi:MAG: hypothetical protein RLZZ341_2710, partial [Pseudomonadota bacterium]